MIVLRGSERLSDLSRASQQVRSMKQPINTLGPRATLSDSRVFQGLDHLRLEQGIFLTLAEEELRLLQKPESWASRGPQSLQCELGVEGLFLELEASKSPLNHWLLSQRA